MLGYSEVNRGSSLRSPTAQILEVALALQRAPGERFRLRERPLPDGIVHLLEVASGSAQALAAAAAEIGHDEQDVLEAARFYLEQVLFAGEDADAYRVLGLAPDAPQDTIRIHHRWLQRWLHPDRAQAGDATVFATRVNQAWAQLRTPELRHDYDVRLAEARLAGADAPLPADIVHRWEQVELPPPEHGRRSRWLLAAALVACTVLAVLIFRHQETIAPWEHQVGDTVAVEAGPAMDDSDVGILAEALIRTNVVAPDAGAPEAAVPVAVAVAAPAAPTAAAPTAAAPTAAAPSTSTRRKTPAGTVISSVTTVKAQTRRVAAAEAAMPRPPDPLPEPEPEPEPESIAASAAPTTAPTTPAPAQDPAIILERMRQAEKRVAQVTAYLADRPGAAPLWNDPQTEAAARQVREQIKPRRGARLELIQPQWRLQRDNASLNAAYRVRSDGGAGQGRLDVQLVWREGLWLVRGVELAPAA